jgi:hypothetical protein
MRQKEETQTMAFVKERDVDFFRVENVQDIPQHYPYPGNQAKHVAD